MIDGLSLIPIAHAVQISTTLPGQYATSSGIGGYVANAYSFSLLIGGILAFGVVVYGGIRYMTSVGNPSGQSDAKEWIEGALLGLLLLVGAYFILKTINPQILNLTLPNTGTVSVAATPTYDPAAAQTAFGGACQNNSCLSNQTCSNIGYGHMCANNIDGGQATAASIATTIPSGDFQGGCTANSCAVGKTCTVDLSHSSTNGQTNYTCI